MFLTFHVCCGGRRVCSFIDAYAAELMVYRTDYTHDTYIMYTIIYTWATGSLQSGDGDWAGGIVGLERNYEVMNHRQPCHTMSYNSETHRAHGAHMK